MCFGLEPIVVASIIGATAAGGTAIYSASQSKKTASPLQLPEPIPLPDPEAIKDQAKDDARRRLAGRTKTILTSGAGIIDEPQTKVKTLLGG